jgi:DNA-binding protein YbaB
VFELDEARYEELTRAAIAGMQTLTETARRLSAVEVEGHSRDGMIEVRVTAAGTVTAVRFRRGALRRYPNAVLGQVLTDTLRATQLKARERYDLAIEAAVPAEVGEAGRLVEEAREFSRRNRP